MKRYSTALLFGLLTLTSQLAHADVIDDAIGNIQQAINDAYNPGSSRNDDDDDRYDRSRQIDSRAATLLPEHRPSYGRRAQSTLQGKKPAAYAS